MTEQVLRNCHISYARHAGLYSICGLALRLRDLYKWEMGLARDLLTPSEPEKDDRHDGQQDTQDASGCQFLGIDDRAKDNGDDKMEANHGDDDR